MQQGSPKSAAYEQACTACGHHSLAMVALRDEYYKAYAAIPCGTSCSLSNCDSGAADIVGVSGGYTTGSGGSTSGGSGSSGSGSGGSDDGGNGRGIVQTEDEGNNGGFNPIAYAADWVNKRIFAPIWDVFTLRQLATTIMFAFCLCTFVTACCMVCSHKRNTSKLIRDEEERKKKDFETMQDVYGIAPGADSRSTKTPRSARGSSKGTPRSMRSTNTPRSGYAPSDAGGNVTPAMKPTREQKAAAKAKEKFAREADKNEKARIEAMRKANQPIPRPRDLRNHPAYRNAQGYDVDAEDKDVDHSSPPTSAEQGVQDWRAGEGRLPPAPLPPAGGFHDRRDPGDRPGSGKAAARLSKQKLREIEKNRRAYNTHVDRSNNFDEHSISAAQEPVMKPKSYRDGNRANANKPRAAGHRPPPLPALSDEVEGDEGFQQIDDEFLKKYELR